MQYLSSIYILFAVQAVFIWRLAWLTNRTREARLFIGLLFVWGIASATMAKTGVYTSDEFLSTAPGFWLPTMPIVIFTALLLSRRMRRATNEVADITPQRWLIAIQAFRITAIGTLIKTVQGSFPMHVELSIGLTDMIYGFSAAVLFFASKRRSISPDALLIWHVTGILIILVPGGLAMQSGLPGSFEVFDYQGQVLPRRCWISQWRLRRLSLSRFFFF